MSSVARGCGVESCERDHYAKGFCNPHWQQLRKKGSTGAIREFVSHIQFCTILGCGRRRETSTYCQAHYKGSLKGLGPARKIRQKHKPEGLPQNCAVPHCEETEWSRGLCKSHVRLRSKFNCSNDMIEALYSNPVCAICGRHEKDPLNKRKLHVDHDHNCCPPNSGCDNCVRGLLCASCNQGIGMFKDNVDFLSSAIKYLNSSVR